MADGRMRSYFRMISVSQNFIFLLWSAVAFLEISAETLLTALPAMEIATPCGVCSERDAIPLRQYVDEGRAAAAAIAYTKYTKKKVAQAATAGRESADTDLDAREVDIDALLSRDQPIFAISELAVFVRCRIRSLFCVPSICAISTLQASSQNPPIPGLSRWHKAELAAKEFSSTKSLFRFFSAGAAA